MTVTLKRNILDRWIIVLSDNHYLGWSGSRWVPVDERGLPSGEVQVSNFGTFIEALHYADLFKFEVKPNRDGARHSDWDNNGNDVHFPGDKS